MIQLSDDSEQEFGEELADYPLSAIGCPSPNIFTPGHFNNAKGDVSPAGRHKSLLSSVREGHSWVWFRYSVGCDLGVQLGVV